MGSETNEQELNKKLAEWAGFEYSHKARTKNFFTGVLGKMVKFWVHPDGYVGELPHFTESLDACSKWLTPMYGNRVEVKFKHGYPSIDTLTCELWRHPKKDDGKDVMSEVFVPTTLSEPPKYYALAFCSAVEKLIDGGTV